MAKVQEKTCDWGMDLVMESEIDKALIFKQPASNLSKATSLTDTLACFGYSVDDRIEQRELVLMYRDVERELELAISQNAAAGCYNEAKEIRSRLTRIRAEFDNRQLSAVQKVKIEQESFFSEAKEGFIESKRGHADYMKVIVTEECERLRADTLLTHAIQSENLEHELSLIPVPRMKYSKRANELMNAEKELIRLCQYDDARKVRIMLDKIVPGEKAQFYKTFEDSKEQRRKNLKKRQRSDLIKLDEKLKAKSWSELRRSERDMRIANLRVETNLRDMRHAHLLQDRLKPEMNITPSALWTKRKNFQNTSSILRGQQLLDMVHGKQKGESVYAEPLVSKHDFRKSLQDTYTFTPDGFRTDVF